MKIIYTIHSLSNSGGMERVITLKANYLVEKFNYDVSIILYDQLDTTTYYELNPKITLVCLSDISTRSIFKFLHISQYIKSKKPDVYICTGGKDIVLARYLPSDFNMYLELHFCFKFPYLREVSRNSSILFKFISLLKVLRNIYYARFYGTIISLTEKDALLWRKFTGVKSITIPNPAQFKQVLRNGCNSDFKRFIAVGRLDSQKGFQDIIKIFALVKSNNWRLDIYGSGEQLNSLLDLISLYNLNNNIFINEPVKEIEKKYSEADCFILSSFYEGMPMVMLEAMSLGLPCIAFDCDSGPSQLIENNVNGFLISKRNIKDFAEKIDYFINISSETYTFYSNSATTSMSQYSIDVILNSLKNILENRN